MLALSSMSPPILHYPMVQKRPKLSLQTSELPMTYGTSGCGLSTIATPTAATTPTTLNTFNNTFDLTHRPSPTSTTTSPSLTRSTSQRDRLPRSQSPRPKKSEAAYSVILPYGYKPILKNTPFPRVRNSSISASPRSSTRRVFFPAPKQVHFRHAIEEVIVNKVYTACHSDLFEPDDHDGSDDDEQKQEQPYQPAVRSSIRISSSSQPRKVDRLRRRNSIEFSGKSTSRETVSEPMSTTSCTRKRRRWEWTLAPIPPKSDVQGTSCGEVLSKHETRSNEPPSSSQQTESYPKYQTSTESRPESALPTTNSAPYQPRQEQDSLASDSCSPSPSSSSTSTILTDTDARPTLPSQMTSPAQPQATSTHPSTQDKTVMHRVVRDPELESALLSPSPEVPLPATLPTTLTTTNTQQRRACSLDSLPRKRKADCLDARTGPGQNSHSSHVDHNHYDDEQHHHHLRHLHNKTDDGVTDSTDNEHPRCTVTAAPTTTTGIANSHQMGKGQTGTTRRDRAATL